MPMTTEVRKVRKLVKSINRNIEFLKSQESKAAALLWEAKETEVWKEKWSSFEDYYTKELGLTEDIVNGMLQTHNLNTLFKTYGKTD